MKTKLSEKNLLFLAGGGEMGALTRTKDWSQTSMGIPQHWSQTFRTTLNLLLYSKFPKFLLWGQDLICFYNDAFRPSLGQNGKHPAILGMKAEEAWTEIWHIIKPLIDNVILNRGAVWNEDLLVPYEQKNSGYFSGCKKIYRLARQGVYHRKTRKRI